MNQGAKICVIDRFTAKHNHERFAAMSVNVGGRVTEPMNVFRINLGHGASSHNGSSSSQNKKRGVAKKCPSLKIYHSKKRRYELSFISVMFVNFIADVPYTQPKHGISVPINSFCYARRYCFTDSERR